MAEFRYKARDSTGASRAGIVDANTRSAAASQLRARGLIVIGVDPVTTKSESKTGIDYAGWLPPRSVDVELSLQQLAMMVKGGMPLLTSIISLIEQAPRKSLATSGKSLSKKFSQVTVFPKRCRNTLAFRISLYSWFESAKEPVNCRLSFTEP